MSIFAYQVRDKSGRKIKGILEAISEKNVAERLSEQGFLVTSEPLMLRHQECGLVLLIRQLLILLLLRQL